MDLGSNVFEYGQSYVGLSRVRNLEGLYLSGFNPQKIKTNPTVIEFYKTIL
jgi:ATP-dependent DNA helicase PIF1